MHRALSWGLVTLLVSGCTWVTLEPGAEDVLVLPKSRLTPACDSVGTVKVSVADRLGALERHDEEVAADLEILARNNASKRGGDTVVPLGPVTDGLREFGIYRCMESDAGDDPDRQNDDVEVLPYDDNG